MEMNDIQKFIEKNKDKVTPIKSMSGEIIGIKVLNKEGLDFTDTNCKMSKDWDKDVIVTNDGKKYDANYENKLEKAKAWAGRTFKKAQLYFKEFNLKDKITNAVVDIGAYGNSVIRDLSRGIRPLTDRLMGVEKHDPVIDPKKPTNVPIAEAKSTKAVADFGTTKVKADNLMKKIEEILSKYEENKKFANDPEIIAFRKRFNEIKSRYEFAMLRNDSPEMLNVKTKLVNLSASIISKQEKLDEKENSPEEKGKGKDPKPPVEPPKPPVPPVEPPKPQRKPKKKKTSPKPISPETSSAIKNTPTPKKPRIRRYEDTKDFRLNSEQLKDMSSLDADVKRFQEEIGIDERKVQNIEDEINEINKKGNLSYDDKEKITQFNEDIKFYKERIEKTKKELAEASSKYGAYMNEKITYYKDGKPYKEASRRDIVGYMQTNKETADRQIAFKEQKKLLEERKKLEEKLKQNTEALGKVGFSIDQPKKEEPTIEEVQDTVRTFHGM